MIDLNKIIIKCIAIAVFLGMVGFVIPAMVSSSSDIIVALGFFLIMFSIVALHHIFTKQEKKE